MEKIAVGHMLLVWVTRYCYNDGRLGPKVSQESPQMGQIRGFFRSDSVHFGSPSQNVLNMNWKNPQICPIWGQFDPLWVQIWWPRIALTRRDKTGGRCHQICDVRLSLEHNYTTLPSQNASTNLILSQKYPYFVKMESIWNPIWHPKTKRLLRSGSQPVVVVILCSVRRTYLLLLHILTLPVANLTHGGKYNFT